MMHGPENNFNLAIFKADTLPICIIDRFAGFCPHIMIVSGFKANVADVTSVQPMINHCQCVLVIRHLLHVYGSNCSCDDMKSFIAKRVNSILDNLRYLRFKLLKYKENNKNICK